MEFDFGRDYLYQEELYGHQGRPCSPGTGATSSADAPRAAHFGLQWALLTFSQPVTAPKACAPPSHHVSDDVPCIQLINNWSLGMQRLRQVLAWAQQGVDPAT